LPSLPDHWPARHLEEDDEDYFYTFYSLTTLHCFYLRRGIRRGFLFAESARSLAGPALRRKMMRTFLTLHLRSFSFPFLRFHVSFFIFVAASAAVFFYAESSRSLAGPALRRMMRTIFRLTFGKFFFPVSPIPLPFIRTTAVPGRAIAKRKSVIADAQGT
jgi:hypothetical protein